MLLHKFWISFAVLAFGATGTLAQDKQTFPNQIVRIVVPVTGGSMADILARELSDKLSKIWNQTVLVENRPGIAGISSVAKSTADGYTLLLHSNGHVIVNKISTNLNFDAVNDFAGVTKVAELPLLAVVPISLPAKTMKEFVALVRDKPGEMSYSSAGLGSTSNIAGALFLSSQGLKMTHVPYRGSPDAYTSIMRNDTQIFFTPPGVGEDLILSGQVHALAVSGPNRLANFPNVPTFSEAGIPESAYTAWFAILAPIGVPNEVLEKLSKDVSQVMKMPEVQARFTRQGVIPSTTTPARMTEILKSDAIKFGVLFDKPR
jgi:tripartite-type tricarboxylate transporter receptor subunit TctC